jgi:hypothetical protein
MEAAGPAARGAIERACDNSAFPEWVDQ